MKNFKIYPISFAKKHITVKDIEYPISYLVGMADSEYNRGVKTNTEIKRNILSYLEGGVYFEPTICIDLPFYVSQIDEYKEYLIVKMFEDSITSYEKAMLETLKNETIHHRNLHKYARKITSFPITYRMVKERLEFEDIIDSVRKSSEYVGTLKKRYNFKLKIISKKYISNRGFYVINAIDENDNLFFWFEKNKVDFNVNDFVKIRATVKKHCFSDFLKAKETHVIRVVLT